jgi:hypothetical protein
MKIEIEEVNSERTIEEQELQNRRNFLRSLGKWSLAVIGCAASSSNAIPTGGKWAYARGSWINGSIVSRSHNSGDSWINGDGWVNRPETVVSGAGDGWINGSGSTPLINRRVN